MSFSRRLTIVLSLSAFVAIAKTSFADVPAPPNYEERCTIEKVQGSGEQCQSCSAYHGDPQACDNSLGTQGFARRCRTRGASVWSEIWCKPTGTSQPNPPADPRFATPPQNDPQRVAVADDNRTVEQSQPYAPAAPPPRGCGGCGLGAPASTAIWLLAAALGCTLIARKRGGARGR